jgi:aspartyl-tRNA(Asn)/glutamyl-tRNA(Gln) amidotransferase subunit C
MLKTGGFTPHFKGEIGGVSKVLSDVARRSLTACQLSLLAQPHFARGLKAALLAMSLTLSDVKRIANLAQLEMDEAHAETALAELNGIFALAEQMQAVDTTGVAPLSQPLAAIMALPLRLRDDVVTEENRREDYQAPAPKAQDGLYLVPKVIE